MNCADFLEGLVDYHFAAESQERREANRTHVRSCEECAQQYFDLKHDIDSGAAQGDRPSEEVRTRLHGEVATLFGPSLFGRTRGWLAAPTPRYRMGAVMAAAAVAVALLWPSRPPVAPPSAQDPTLGSEPDREAQLYRKERPYPLTVPRTMPASIVDSARVDALSITYY